MQHAPSLARGLPQGFVRTSLAIVAGSLLMTLAAKYQVPFYPVPMSLQTLVAIGLGFAFGPVVGATAIVFYLLQGLVGLPVFANSPERGIGLAYMAGPTGGYLIGFALAAATSGLLSRLTGARSFLPALAIALIAGAVVYLPGLLWLGTIIGFDASLPAAGLIPFLPGDLMKACIAALLFVQGSRMLDRKKAAKT